MTNTHSKSVTAAVMGKAEKAKIYVPAFVKVMAIVIGVAIGVGSAEYYLQIYKAEPEVVVEEKIVYKEVPKNIQTDNVEVIVEYFLHMEPALDPKIARVYAEAVSDSSKKYQLPPALIVSMIDKETIKFNPLSVSSAKCVGLMQINPKAHPEKIKGLTKDELFHVDKNVDIGCQILKDYIESEGTIEKALHKYSGGAKDYVNDVLIRFAELTLFHYETFGFEIAKKEEKSEFTNPEE